MDINEEAFDKLLARLEPDLTDPMARYKQLRLKMIKFFQWKRCGDAESLADETIARTAKSILEGNEIYADNPYVFILVIARNVYREYVRKEIKHRTLMSNLSEPETELRDSEDCKVQCLLSLPPDKLRLLQEYFLDEKSSKQLAEEHKTTINGLRLQIHRLKKGLQSCFENCNKKLSDS